jgi:hypothetical protein
MVDKNMSTKGKPVLQATVLQEAFDLREGFDFGGKRGVFLGLLGAGLVSLNMVV